MNEHDPVQMRQGLVNLRGRMTTLESGTIPSLAARVHILETQPLALPINDNIERWKAFDFDYSALTGGPTTNVLLGKIPAGSVVTNLRFVLIAPFADSTLSMLSCDFDPSSLAASGAFFETLGAVKLPITMMSDTSPDNLIVPCSLVAGRAEREVRASVTWSGGPPDSGVWRTYMRVSIPGGTDNTL